VLEIPSSVLDPFLDGLDGTPRKKKTFVTMFQLYLSKHIICDPESNEPIRITPVEKFPTREDDEELCKRFMEWLPTQYPNLRHAQPVAGMGPIAADAPPPVPITAKAPPSVPEAVPSVPEAVPDETEERLKREIEAGLKRARLAELEAKLAEARLREDLANAARAAAETKRKEEIEAAAAAEAKRKEETAAMEAKRKEEAETKRREEALAAALAEAKRKEAARAAAEAKRREEEAAEAKRREEIQAAAAAEARRKEDAKAAAEAFNRHADQQEIAKKELEEARQMKAQAEVGRKRPRDDGLSGPTTKKPSLLSTLTSAIPVLFGAIYDTLNDPDGAAAEAGNSPK
jgi:chemotaxis protein histidine kinase CheA